MKFADFFPTMGEPKTLLTSAVSMNVETQYGITHILTMQDDNGSSAEWYIKPEKFNELFAAPVAPGTKLTIVKNPSTRPGGYPFYTIAGIDGKDADPSAITTRTAKPRSFGAPTGPKKSYADNETEREKTGYRAGLAGVWQALVVSGVSPEEAFAVAPTHARQLRKMADEMYYTDVAAGEIK